MCRLATCSAAAILGWIKLGRLTWCGEEQPAEYRSSHIAVRKFCRACGTPLALTYDGGTEVALHFGTVEQAADHAPQYHYGVESRLPWFDAGLDLPGRASEEKLIPPGK